MHRQAYGFCWSILLWIAPEPGFGPPFSGRGLLVGTDQGGVEHEVLVVGVVDQRFEDPLPDARLGPSCEALVQALPLALAFRQVTPVGARAQDPPAGQQSMTTLWA